MCKMVAGSEPGMNDSGVEGCNHVSKADDPVGATMRGAVAFARLGTETYRDSGPITAVPAFATAIALLSVRRRFVHITNPVSN